jgi:hypothetical protein
MFRKLCCRAPRIRIVSTSPENPGGSQLPSSNHKWQSRLLRGERKFNTTHIRITAEALNLDAALLI